MQNGIKRGGREKNTKIFVIILLLSSLFPVALYADNSVVVTAPTSASVTSTYRMRSLSGGPAEPHRGVDYGVSCGTEFAPRNGGSLRCSTINGYGVVGDVSHACGVTERYAHLSSCSASGGKMISGNTGISVSSTGGDGCHLHHEIRINGTAVDPAVAQGRNLCDSDVQRELIADAQNKLNGLAGGGAPPQGGAGGEVQGKPDAPTGGSEPDNIQYVPSGQPDPYTGVINTGPGYYVTETKDGRIQTETAPGTDENTSTLVPPTTTNVVSNVNAGDEVTGCATDTWTAMVNQAVLQSRREMAMNKRYIAKADSVLSYSCFSKAIDKVRFNAGVFSESQRWVNHQVDLLEGSFALINVQLGQFSLDGALTNAALEPYETFLRSYFSHEFLGGLADTHSAGGGAGGGATAHEHSSQQAYVECGKMAEVWNEAKCLNVTDDPLFYKFSDLITKDPREYPENYKCFDTGITQGMINVAQNKSAQFSKVDPYLDILYPDGGNCAPAIPTGVTVYRQKGPDQITQTIDYPDGLCLTAGCSYQNGGDATPGTCQIK